MKTKYEVSWNIPPFYQGQRFFGSLDKARRLKKYIQRGLRFKAKLTKIN